MRQEHVPDISSALFHILCDVHVAVKDFLDPLQLLCSVEPFERFDTPPDVTAVS